MVELGRKLRSLRLDRGLHQRQVAERIGVTTSVISAYENNIRQPSYEVFIKLARLFDVSADYLLGIDDNHDRAGQNLVSLDGLTPARISLVRQLIETLKE